MDRSRRWILVAKKSRTMRTIQTCGSSDPINDEYSLTIGFEKQAITLDGLSKEDMLELQSCINCMLFEEESDGTGKTS